MRYALPLPRVLLLVLGVAGPGPIRAQSGARPPLSDIRMVELVGGVMIERFSVLIARAALDSTADVPLDLRLPTTGPVQLWQRFGSQLNRMMRARPPVDADSSTRLLHVREVVVGADTLRAWVSTGFAINCRPGWAEDRVEHLVMWVRRSNDFWHLVSDKPWLYSESFGICHRIDGG